MANYRIGRKRRGVMWSNNVTESNRRRFLKGIWISPWTGVNQRPRRGALHYIIKHNTTSSGQRGDKGKTGEGGLHRAIACAAEPYKKACFPFVEVRFCQRRGKSFGRELRRHEGGGRI